MPYHNFEPGQAYSFEYIVSELTKFLDDGRYDDVPGKKEHLKHIKDFGCDEAVWSPFAEAEWGASPINPKAWKKTDGQEL